MFRMIAIAGFLTASTVAQAATVSFDAAVPFKLQFGKTNEEIRNGGTYTIIDGTITNGPHYLNNAQLHCSARNAAGNSWDIVGKVANLAPKEKGAFRLVSSSPDETGQFTKPTKVICAVKSFELGFM